MARQRRTESIRPERKPAELVIATRVTLTPADRAYRGSACGFESGGVTVGEVEDFVDAVADRAAVLGVPLDKIRVRAHDQCLFARVE